MPQKKDTYVFPEFPDLPKMPDLTDFMPDPPKLDIPEPPVPPALVSEKEQKIPTPFGDVELQPPTPPKVTGVKWDKRRLDILQHTIAIDLSTIVALIPGVGDLVADAVEDAHGAELRKKFTPTEANEYARQDKTAPSTLAAIRTFQTVR